jgi:hypothetical protein
MDMSAREGGKVFYSQEGNIDLLRREFFMQSKFGTLLGR